MKTIIKENITLEGRFPYTSMPDEDWWNALWPEPVRTLQALGLQKGMSVLDLGCGYGHFTIAAAKLVNPAPVVGIEIDRMVLAEARQTSKALGNCLWLNEDMLHLSRLIMNKFDYIMMHSTFHGIPDSTRLVREVASILSPGGYFSVINWLPIPREKTIWLGKPRGPKTEIRISPEKLISIVQTAAVGLSYVEQIELSPYHYGINFQLTS